MAEQFKALKRTADGAELVELSEEQSSRIPIYAKALEVAANSQVPDPKFSRYFVRESIGVRSMYQAGNVEYGFCQALHGEESAVAVLKASLNSHEAGEPLVMGIISDNSEFARPVTPCGNCRDIMRDVLGPDLEIVGGLPDRGVAVVAKLSDYLFEEIRPAGPPLPEELESYRADVGYVFNYGIHFFEFDGYSLADIHPERNYFAGVLTSKRLYVGGLDLMCDFHPIYPLRDAIRQVRRAMSGDYNCRAVIIVGRDTSPEMANVPPHVMYKDRQHLMEFNLGQELLLDAEDAEIDPPVMLVRCGRDPRGRLIINKAWQTSVKEWLPFPFSPKNFGPKFVSEFIEYLKMRR